MKNLKAILFDMDGVLWDSNQAHRRGFEKALKEAGNPWRMTPARYSSLAGMRTELVLKKLSAMEKAKTPHVNLVRIADRKRYWAQRFLPQAPLRRGVAQTVKRLAPHYKLALVTSGHPASVKVFFKRSGLRRYFSAVLSSREIPFSKPSPRVYGGALKKLHIKAAEALVIEDAEQGVRAGVSAGVRTFGVRGTCSATLLRRAGANKIISEIPDLLKHVLH